MWASHKMLRRVTYRALVEDGTAVKLPGSRSTAGLWGPSSGGIRSCIRCHHQRITGTRWENAAAKERGRICAVQHGRSTRRPQVTQRQYSSGANATYTEDDLVRAIRSQVPRTSGSVSSECPTEVISVAREIDTPSSRVLLLGAAVKCGDINLAHKVFEDAKERNEITDTHIAGLTRAYVSIKNPWKAVEALSECGGIQQSLTMFTRIRREILELCCEMHDSSETPEHGAAQTTKRELKRLMVTLIPELLPVYNECGFGVLHITKEHDVSSELRKIDRLLSSKVVPQNNEDSKETIVRRFADAVAAFSKKNEHLRQYVARKQADETDVNILPYIFSANLLLEAAFSETSGIRLPNTGFPAMEKITKASYDTQRSWTTVWFRWCAVTGEGTEAVSMFSRMLYGVGRPVLLGCDVVSLAIACTKEHNVDAVFRATELIKAWAERKSHEVTNGLTSAGNSATISTGEILFRRAPRCALSVTINWLLRYQRSYGLSSTLSLIESIQSLPQPKELSAPFYDSVIATLAENRDFPNLIGVVKNLAVNNLLCTPRAVEYVLRERKRELSEYQSSLVPQRERQESLPLNSYNIELVKKENNGHLVPGSKHVEDTRLSVSQWRQLFRSMIRLCKDPLNERGAALSSELSYPDQVNASGEQLPQGHYRYLRSLEKELRESGEDGEEGISVKRTVLESLGIDELPANLDVMEYAATPDSETGSQGDLVALIRATCEAGEPEDSLRYFEEFERLGSDVPVVALEALLWGCAHTKRPDTVFEIMRATGDMNIPLSSNQIDALVSCCVNNNSIETGKNVILKGLNAGCPPSEYSWLSLF
eukprot:gb/GECG01007479.1/.p1 GENE.gb/GECG01007479.1/~~gb/GECG01007479.1/.p1  ORF type:complete len:825 (+),score=76.79 gb/GECG01007479.1/:1-2475(+)